MCWEGARGWMLLSLGAAELRKAGTVWQEKTIVSQLLTLSPRGCSAVPTTGSLSLDP